MGECRGGSSLNDHDMQRQDDVTDRDERAVSSQHQDVFRECVEDLDRRGLRRRPRIVGGDVADVVDVVDGTAGAADGGNHTRIVADFTSNDYLGLSTHPRVRQAIAKAALEFGTWRSSPVVGGYSVYHRDLERALIALKKTEECMLFSSGFAANLGVMTSLARLGYAFFSDELNHASLIDGMRSVGRGRKHVYRHNDLGHLEELLCSMDEKRAAVVTDRLFSMDGDFCDLEGLLRLQKRFGFLLVVDEAHSTLVCVDGDYDRTGGTGGAGWPNEDVIRVGTLSKAVRRFPSSSVKIQRRFISLSLSLSLSSGRADGGLCVLHDRRPGRALQPRPDVRLLDGVERADGRGSSSGDRAGDRTGGREEEGVALAGGACVRGEQPDPPAAGAGRGRAGGGPGAHGGRRGAGGRDQAADCGRVPGADERLLRRGCRAGGGGALVGAVRGAVRSGEAVVIYLLEVVWVVVVIY